VTPEISVVVPSHDRPLRLRWLLNALEEQTADRSRWEVIVAHDSSGPETDELLRTHPLAAAGVLRHMSFEPGPGPAAKRNAAWRAARGATIAFTDDDCRPPADWMDNVLAAARRHPAGIVQGTTRVDPDELEVKLRAPFARSQEVTPPVPWAQTCNILYPRAVLERTGGFDESLPLAAGEDTDLAYRARDLGVEYIAAPEMVTYHAVEAVTLPARVREVWRWQHLPFVPKRHPQVRKEMPGGGWFWKPSHVRMPFAFAGLALLPRRPVLGAALIAPWALSSMPSYGPSLRGRLRALSELPAHAAIDATEFAAMVRGSIRYRCLVL